MRSIQSLVVLFMFLAVAASARAAFAAPTVAFTPSTNNLSTGQSTTVSIDGTSFAQTTEGGGFSLQFNPQVARVTAVTVDTATWEFFTSVGAIDNVGGVVHDIVFASFAGRSGTFPIVKVTFQCVGTGTGALILSPSSVNPFASGGQSFPVTFLSGSIVNNVVVVGAPVPVGPGATAAIGFCLIATGWYLTGRRAVG